MITFKFLIETDENVKHKQDSLRPKHRHLIISPNIALRLYHQDEYMEKLEGNTWQTHNCDSYENISKYNVINILEYEK